MKIDRKERFIIKANEKHGEKYDYSKLEYVDAHTKVCIICPKHGEFWQTPNSHLNGCGCPKCGGNKSLTTEEFIEKAKQIHGEKYDYSKVEYVNANTKVYVICPIHGEFWVTPANHLRERGCSQCYRTTQG
jgi:protein-arginine kinase activator protein McsA